MSSHLPFQRGLSTPDAFRRLSAALHIFECPQMPWGIMKKAAKPSPDRSFRASQKSQSAHVNCTSLPSARALITVGKKGVVKWCQSTTASLKYGVHRCPKPANAPECAAAPLGAFTGGVTALNGERLANRTSIGNSVYTFQPRHLVKFTRLWKPPDDSRNHTQAGSPS